MFWHNHMKVEWNILNYKYETIYGKLYTKFEEL